MAWFTMGSATTNWVVHGIVFVAILALSIANTVLLIPLDSVPAVTGVTIILVLAYVISIAAWALVMANYAATADSLTMLLTHVVFLLVIPMTIGATAMNVVSIQNTRNIIAGKVST